MQLHPLFMTSLIDERERVLRRRAEKQRVLRSQDRPVRSAPWPP